MRLSYPRALLLITASSLLVPVAGLATAPLLTHQLGVEGRGELGAALAPWTLIVGAATLGLPEALAFLVARDGRTLRAGVRRSLVLTAAIGAAATLVGGLASPALSAGDAGLARFMVLATLMAMPALGVGVLRGAASGLQRWDLVVAERVVGTLARLVGLVLLSVCGQLSVLTALLVSTAAPVMAGLVYLRLDPTAGPSRSPALRGGPLLNRDLLHFGSRVWLGGVATVLVSRVPQLMIVPLSTTAQLGLYVVAVTISDIPYIVIQTVRDLVFGSAAADRNDERMLLTSRLATTTAVACSVVLGATLPWWIGAVFGSGFSGAIITTDLLLLSSVIAVPGLIAGAAIAAEGRPAIRTVAITVGLAVDAIGLLLLIPRYGAAGAAMANLLCTATTTAWCLAAARSLLGTRWHRYVVPTPADARRCLDLARPSRPPAAVTTSPDR